MNERPPIEAMKLAFMSDSWRALRRLVLIDEPPGQSRYERALARYEEIKRIPK